ncbi:hypothetical protein ACFL48_05110, partial [Pseudomonadota bacterium]
MQSFRVSKKSLWLIPFLAGGVVALVTVESVEGLYVMMPIVIAVWICAWFILSLWKMDREIPILDIGVFCVAFTTLYTVMPLLNFYFGGLSFGLLSDYRLQSLRPSAIEMGLFSINYLVYLGSLAVTYLIFRKPNDELPRFQFSRPSSSVFKVAVLVFLVLTVYFDTLLYGFDIGFKSGYGDES